VLRRNEYFIETSDSNIMSRLKNFKCIKDGIEQKKKEEARRAREQTEASTRNDFISRAALDNLNDR